jgi:diketogulonate reductase-like aldo/keto reductase
MLLSSGYTMPKIGFGTSSDLDPKELYTAVKIGYRHFDIATKHRNEEQVGNALQRCITEQIVTREELFITTKLWHIDHKDPEAALILSLKKLKIDYLDLFLLHWPLNDPCN